MVGLPLLSDTLIDDQFAALAGDKDTVSLKQLFSVLQETGSQMTEDEFKGLVKECGIGANGKVTKDEYAKLMTDLR